MKTFRLFILVIFTWVGVHYGFELLQLHRLPIQDIIIGSLFLVSGGTCAGALGCLIGKE